VHCAADYSGYGIARDDEIAATLEKSGIDFVKTGSGYAVAPGRVTKDDATYYKVYTPFYKRWLIHGWRAPAADPAKWPSWIGAQTCDGYPLRPDTQGVLIPAAGEAGALELFETFLAGPIENYADDRYRPDLAGTSKFSIALKWGEAGEVGRSALIASGLVLFLITLAVNMIARWIIARRKEFSGAS
jgi:deoxyribodipyrimidine photo-lyase